LWTTITTAGAPVARFGHTAVWSGTEMIVWGGWDGTNRFNSGGRYNPATGTWTAMSTVGAPSPRTLHTAVWTGTEMIVWGGADGTTNYLYTGARYNPTANTWVSLPTNGAPSGRYSHTAVWTGTEMIIWGGAFYGGLWSSELNTGGRYNPAANAWTPVSTSGAPLGRSEHTAVWTGTEMIVWAGRGKDGTFWGPMNYGSRYNPVGDSWVGMTTEGAPNARVDHTAVWTGAEMIVWAGNAVSECNDGGVYRPPANSWRPLTTFGAPAKRALHTAVWTGAEMIIWGGSDYTVYYNDTYSYTPPRVLYLYQKP
jgi:N-acetylneuraminic acid mutarotase